MQNEPYWLSPEEIIELNRLIVAGTGEPFFVRSEPLLESALQNPRDKFNYGGETDVVALAVYLLFAIARNHPFGQGNKRTAFEAAILFLEANGYAWLAPDSLYIARAVIAVLVDEMTILEFANLFEPFVEVA